MNWIILTTAVAFVFLFILLIVLARKDTSEYGLVKNQSKKFNPKQFVKNIREGRQ